MPKAKPSSIKQRFVPFFISITVMPTKKANEEAIAELSTKRFPYDIAGFLLFPSKHLSKLVTPEQARDLVRDIIVELKKRMPNCLIAVDLECQSVNRLEALIPKDKRLANGDLVRTLWAFGLKQQAKDLVEAHFELLSSIASDVGIDLLFGVVLDLYVDELGYRDTHGMRTRSWAESAEALAYLFEGVTKICQDNGVVPVFKHLPGIGCASRDTHDEISEIRNITFRSAPYNAFQHGIEAFAGVINSSVSEDPNVLSEQVVVGMVSHCIYSDVTIDNGLRHVNVPTCCSSNMLAVIRYSLSVPGPNLVLFSDAVDMRGFVNKMNSEGVEPKDFGKEVFCNVCLQGVTPVHGAIEARKMSEVIVEIFVACKKFQEQWQKLIEMPCDSKTSYLRAHDDVICDVGWLSRHFQALYHSHKEKINKAFAGRTQKPIDMEAVYPRRPLIGDILAFKDVFIDLSELNECLQSLRRNITEECSDRYIVSASFRVFSKTSINSIMDSAESLCKTAAGAVIEHTGSMLEGFCSEIEELPNRTFYDKVELGLKKLSVKSGDLRKSYKDLLRQNNQNSAERLEVLYEEYDQILKSAEEAVKQRPSHRNENHSAGSSGSNMSGIVHSGGIERNASSSSTALSNQVQNIRSAMYYVDTVRQYVAGSNRQSRFVFGRAEPGFLQSTESRSQYIENRSLLRSVPNNATRVMQNRNTLIAGPSRDSRVRCSCTTCHDSQIVVSRSDYDERPEAETQRQTASKTTVTAPKSTTSPRRNSSTGKGARDYDERPEAETQLRFSQQVAISSTLESPASSVYALRSASAGGKSIIRPGDERPEAETQRQTASKTTVTAPKSTTSPRRNSSTGKRVHWGNEQLEAETHSAKRNRLVSFKGDGSKQGPFGVMEEVSAGCIANEAGGIEFSRGALTAKASQTL